MISIVYLTTDALDLDSKMVDAQIWAAAASKGPGERIVAAGRRTGRRLGSIVFGVGILAWCRRDATFGGQMGARELP